MNDFSLTNDTEQVKTAPINPTRYGKLDLRCMDNMELMAQFPDKYFELAIVDPPYGIGMDGNANWSGSKHAVKAWDSEPPSLEYFAELQRVAKKVIVWGANHFIERLPVNSSCWIVWDKKNDGFSFADAELAWTNLDTAVRCFRFARGQDTDERIHPTQKPVALYKWLLTNYAKQGDKILDTHLGSGSIAIACHYLGFDLTGCELDHDYFAAMQDRIKRETQQMTLL
jgi:site-specific DNA-methyltransferase (adenine-specific)